MRRIVLILVLVAVVGIAGFVLLRPKRPAASGRKPAASDSSGTKATAGRSAARKGGKAAGKLKPKTEAERKAEVRRIREEERRRKRELRRQERERRRALRYARSRKGKRRGRKGQAYYVVKAIVSLGDESYALVDSRRVQVGDVIMGRRIVAVLPDRVEIEAFGKRSSVKVGESLLPPSFGTSSRR